MYEMEGASSPNSPSSPIARPTATAEHATITRQSRGKPRSTRCPPPGTAPSQDDLPALATLSRALGSVAHFRKLPDLDLSDRLWDFSSSRVTVSGGVQDF